MHQATDSPDVILALIPMGSIVVPCWGSYLGSYKVIPKKELQVLEPMGISVTPAPVASAEARIS